MKAYGSLPGSWATATIGDLVKARGEKAQPLDYPDLPYIGMEHVEAHSMRLLGTVPAGSMKSIAARCHAGDVIYARLRPYLNKIYRPTTSGLCSSEFIVLIPERGIVPGFVQYLLNSTAFVAFSSHLNEGDRPRVDFGQIAAYEIRVAPEREQTRIVAEVESLLSRVEAAVAELGKIKANLFRYRASVLKAACDGRLVPTEADLARAEGRKFEAGSRLLDRIVEQRAGAKGSPFVATQPELTDTVELPEGWCWASVDMVGDVLLGRRRAPEYWKGRAPLHYLRVANIKDDWIDFSDLEQMEFDEVHAQRYRLEPGDILVSEGQSTERLGQSAIFRGEHGNMCFQSTLHRFRSIPGGPSSEYAQIVFRSHVKSGVFRRFGSITTNIGHLTLEKFKSVPFPLPPVAEQARIVAEVKRLMSFADALAATIDAALTRAARLRQSILKRAFEGKLVPQDPNDEPASVLLERIHREREANDLARRQHPPVHRRRVRGSKKATRS